MIIIKRTFTKDGEFLVLLPDGTSLPATISWEKKEKDTLTLRMEVSTLLGDVKTKQDCEYQFKGKNTLILQMAGSEITLKRDKDWSLNDFKVQAQEMVGKAAEEAQKATEEAARTITFGHYEQDNDTSNGAEEIEWIVLKEESGKKLIISKYALNHKKYNTRFEDVTWETCTLRSWLNNDFYNSAFTSEEQAKIVTVTNNNPDASRYDKSWEGKGGNVTSDNVFCLSYEEAPAYFSTDGARECSPTAYATAQGVWPGSGSCYWWLRSPDLGQRDAMGVNYGGSLGHKYVIDASTGVRPALWISTK